MIDVHCCAATCIHLHVCGDGRHLAALPAELPQQLPQVGTRRTTRKTIQNQHSKNNTLVDYEYLWRHRNIAMEPEDPEVTQNFDMPVTFYLRHLQHQKMKDVNFTAGLIKLKNRFIEYLKLKDTELNKGNQLVRKKMTKTKIGVTQILKTRGTELNNKNLTLRKKKTKTKISVTQAGSERLLTKLIREFISGEEFV